jgi:ABC-type polysaccharide/polyol phosphate transport system ATPase subunit
MSQKKENVIVLDSVSKNYRLYKRNSDRVRETFHPLRKQYHKPFKALDNISFSLKKGKSLGIIGKNGSGKSTLLQLLCGVLQPSSGEVHVNGRISALLELGAGFNPEFTGRENVYLSATIMGLSRDFVDRNIEQIFAFADIGEYVDQPVKLYSSGMYVRLAFATAISVKPEILIVDEALAVGDIFFQQKCIAHMKEMKSKATIVFVTHDMQTVSNLCERVIVLDGGKVCFDGDPIDAVSHYTKLVHNERFQSKNSSIINGSQQSTEFDSEKREGWLFVGDNDRGGALEIEISKVRITDENDEVKQTVIKGDIVRVHLAISSKKDIQDIIVGYTIKDRLGNAIFGENTKSSLSEQFCVKKGDSIVTYEFLWPEVYPETYTITVGIGEGKDPFVHKIHCWAHNIASLNALSPDRGVHGIFNNLIQSCSIKCLSV